MFKITWLALLTKMLMAPSVPAPMIAAFATTVPSQDQGRYERLRRSVACAGARPRVPTGKLPNATADHRVYPAPGTVKIEGPPKLRLNDAGRRGQGHRKAAREAG
jgi:hypothetical protein